MFGNSKSFQTRKQTMENTSTPLENLGTYQKIRLKNSVKNSGAYNTILIYFLLITIYTMTTEGWISTFWYTRQEPIYVVYIITT